MQEESVLRPNIPQGDDIQRKNNRSGALEKQSGSSFSRKKNFHGKNQFYQRESVRGRMIKKFFKLVGAMVGVFLLAGTIAVFIINGSQANTDNNALAVSTPTAPPTDSSTTTEAEDIAAKPTVQPSESILLPPAKTNFFVVGKDVSGLLTDVMIVGCFNRDTYEISLVSIPRDTLTILPRERLSRMQELGLYAPADGTMKMNEVNSYGQQQYGMALLQEQIQDVLGVDIKYVIEIDLQAFRNIVDDLGGVYFEIPKPGMYYKDDSQALNIAIPPGFQYLDGKTAEGVVRYREYRDGDIDRIEVQQEFLKALFSQVLERENILGNAFSIAKSIISYSKTNFSITDLPLYLRYINDINTDNFNFYTLPCTPEYIGKVSYVIPNDEQIQELVNDIFYKVTEPEETPSETVPEVSEEPTAVPKINSKGMRIEVLNGSGINGIARSFKEAFESDGFTVTNIDDYTGAQMDATQIIVKTTGMGSDLLHYFKDSIIQVLPEMPEDYDIIIITGRGEA